MISDANFYPRKPVPHLVREMREAVERFCKCKMELPFHPPVPKTSKAVMARQICAIALRRMFPKLRRYSIAAALGVEIDAISRAFRVERSAFRSKSKRSGELLRGVDVAIRAYCGVYVDGRENEKQTAREVQCGASSDTRAT